MSLPVEVSLTMQESDQPWGRSKEIRKFVSAMMIKNDFAKVRLSQSEFNFEKEDEDDRKSIKNSDVDESTDDLHYEDDDIDRDDISEAGVIEVDDDEMSETPHARPVRRWPNPLMPPNGTGQNYQIRVTNVDVTGQIYGHLYTNRHHLRQMKNAYSNLYSDVLGEDNIDLENELFTGRIEATSKRCWKRGEACVVKYEDHFWYRGQLVQDTEITSKKPKKPDATVFLVDIGIYFTVYTADLKIPYHFGNLPILACRFVLDNICSLNGEGALWDEDVTSRLGKLLHYHNKRCSTNGTCSVVQTRDAENFPLPVELKFQSPDRPEEWIDLSDRLVNHWRNAHWLPEGKLLDVKASKYLEEADNVEAMISKNDGSSMSYDMYCSQAGIFDKQTDQISPCSNTSELCDDMSLNPWNSATRHFYIGEILKVEITNFCSWNPYMTAYLKESSETVSHVFKSMNKHSDKCIPLNPCPGQPVTCYLDKKWQRGFVMKVKDPCTTANAITKLAVYFVDTNESRWIKNTKYVRSMSKKLKELPMYSFKIFYDNSRRSRDGTSYVDKLRIARKNRHSIYVEVTNGGLSTNIVHGKLLIGKGMIPIHNYNEKEDENNLDNITQK